MIVKRSLRLLRWRSGRPREDLTFMPRLVVFDLDGTLVDSRRDIAASANLLLAELGAEPLAEERIGGMVGEGARTLVRRLVTAAGLEVDIHHAFERFLAIYDEHLVDHTVLYPGMDAALEAARARARLAVLTNKPQHHTDRLLAALGIGGRFIAVIGGDTSFPRKPDPSAFIDLAGRAGALVSETVMVGDSLVDLETARRASAIPCIVTYGFGRFDPADLAGIDVCHDPSDLAGVLTTILGRDRAAAAPPVK
jgi:phosphoglycolate phosphatase